MYSQQRRRRERVEPLRRTTPTRDAGAAARSPLVRHLPVPRRPDRSQSPRTDHRLDPYRNRGGVVVLDDHQVLHVYVQVDALWTQTSGHLWWRRWSPPREFVILHMLFDDETQGDTWLVDDALDDELADWSKGRFKWDGHERPLTWFHAEESAGLRQTLGLDAN